MMYSQENALAAPFVTTKATRLKDRDPNFLHCRKANQLVKRGIQAEKRANIRIGKFCPGSDEMIIARTLFFAGRAQTVKPSDRRYQATLNLVKAGYATTTKTGRFKLTWAGKQRTSLQLNLSTRRIHAAIKGGDA